MRRLEFNSDVSHAGEGAGAAGGDRWVFGLSGARRLAVGLVAVIVVYAIYKIVLCDPRFLEDTSRALRHFMKFGIVIVVYGLGVFGFFRNSQGWVLSVWHILYVGMLVLLTLVGVFDAVGGGLPMVARGLTTTVFEFLISPVPLVVLLVVNRVMGVGTADGR